MISIIVCSRDEILFKNLEENIEATISSKYELIKIDNSANNFSISKAYNKGASEAKYPVLCFVHEDVLFKTKDWGLKITNHFERLNNAGIIGIAGGVYKTKMASAWWEYEKDWLEHRRINIMQHYKHNKESELILINPFNEFYSEVLILDGVLLFTQKETWIKNPFDERIVAGFHGYDMDFCLQVNQSKKNYVVYDILIDHFSGGSVNVSYYKTLMQLHKKWKKKLPLAVENYYFDSNNVYEDGWKRIRKNMSAFRRLNNNFFENLSYYKSLTGLLDYKPTAKKHLYNLLSNLFLLIRSFTWKKTFIF